MSNNKIFPNWNDANKVIEERIMTNFSVYVNLLKSKVNNKVYLYIGFLPATRPVFDDLPEESWATIKNIYDVFMEWANVELSIQDLLKLQDKHMSVTGANNFRSILSQHINEYEKEHNTKIDNIFRACLGIGDIGILPRQLQKSIYGEIVN